MGAMHPSIEQALGAGVVSMRPLGGGCVGDVRLVELADGRRVVVKQATGDGAAALAIEARMLRFMDAFTSARVPRVLADPTGALVMEAMPTGGAFGATAQADAASMFAALHAISPSDIRWESDDAAPDPAWGDRAFGFGWDTVIGGLHQPNAWRDSWRAFFAEHRLLYMSREAERAGRLPSEVRKRIERLTGQLERWIDEPQQSSLIHGDAWGGNILIDPGGKRVSALIDPALYFADPEIELAFGTLFGTYGQPFFEHYADARPVWNREGFFEQRRDLYNLYPLLVHVRLFGGGYVQDVETTLRSFGL